MIFSQERVRRLLNDMGIEASEFRADAGETGTFERDLRYVEAEIYRVEYPGNKARDYIPLDTSVPEWAESFEVRIFDWAGMAKIISNYADDLPAVDIIAGSVIHPIRTIGDSFGYSIQDLVRAQKTGLRLDTEKGELARMAIENKIESLSVFGDASAGLAGFLNNPNVPLLSAPGSLNGDWLNPATTPKMILADMHKIGNAAQNNTKYTRRADTMLLPTEEYSRVSTETLNDHNDTTILEAFLKNSQSIRFVDQWHYLDKADAAGTGPRVIAYNRDKKVVRMTIPQEFRMQPPQPRNLAFTIPCHSRYGGVSWRYPLGGVYADLAA